MVELKKTQGTDQVVGQTLRYMGWVREEYPENKVRGVIIVPKKDEALRYALNATSGRRSQRIQIVDQIEEHERSWGTGKPTSQRATAQT